jgi:hypothetical protein
MTMATEMINVSVDLDVYKAIEGRRSSFSQSQNDILKQCLGITGLEPIVSHKTKNSDQSSHPIRKRVTGNYSFMLLGRSYHFSSLKEAYLECLNLLSKRDSNFLSALSKVETHARRVISNEPSRLYINSPHLAERYAERLNDDWWIDVNLSQLQVESRLEDACKIAGLKFGSDLRLEFPGE